MAQIKCNECGKGFSDNLKECPHCGCPKEENYHPTMIDPTFTKEKKDVDLTCKNCGNKVEEKFKICPYCGENLKEAKSDSVEKAKTTKKKETIICQDCNFEFAKNAKECPNCGCPVEDALKNEAEPIVPKRGRPKKEKLIVCQECGLEFKAELKACPECGCPVENPSKEPTIEVNTPKEEIKPIVPKTSHHKNEKQITCQECGFEFNKDLEKCPECGYHFKEPKDNATLVTEATSESNLTTLKTKNHKKSNGNKIIFYIFIALFFIGGCATAVFIYDKVQKNNNNETNEKKNYKINRTISCISAEGNEERNYYFADRKLIKYSLYSYTTYNSEAEIEQAMDKFQKEFDNTGNATKIRFNRNAYSLENVLIYDFQKSTKEYVIEYGITKDYSPIKIRETMENENWQCKETDADLGENLPLNDLKSAKEKLEEYLIKDGYNTQYDTTNNNTNYSKTDGDEKVTINITNGTYTYSEIDEYKTILIVYNFLTGKQNIQVAELGNRYTLDFDTKTKEGTCTGDEYWCNLHSNEYFTDEAIEVEEDFNEILRKANVSIENLKRD